jgi:integrase
MADRKRIGLREVRALKPNTEIWDAGLPGFGARRQRSEAVAYVVLYRTAEGRMRRFTIGRHGAPWTPDTARAKALAVLAEAQVEGGDPAADKQAKRRAENVTELCDAYWADAEAGRLMTRLRRAKKPSTLLSDRGRIEKHIKPRLGRLKVAAVTREDIEAFMHDVAEGKTAARAKTGKKRGLSNVRGGMGAASRTVGLLGAIFTYAVRHRMRTDNPVHGVMRPADGKRARRLSDDEYAAMGAALRQAQAQDIWPAAVAAVRFLVFTGWRSGEALALTWGAVDLARRTATLADTKTGRSVRPLSDAACDILRGLDREGDDALVFPPTRGRGTMTGFRRMFDRIAKLGKLPAAVTPHVLRHSFASLAADVGFSEPTIAALVGHKGHSITSRYVHSADAVLLAAADAVANEAALRMGEARPPQNVVALRAVG